MNADFLSALKRVCKSSVRLDKSSLAAYSEDASFLHLRPIAVVQPNSLHMMQQAVKLCAIYKIPFTARGSATGTTGGCLGKGVIIDCSTALNAILRCTEDTITLQPGVVLADANRELGKIGRRIGPETSTEQIATIGGMLANNAAGGESLRYGTMIDAVLQAQVLLSNGSIKHLHHYQEKSPSLCTPFERHLLKAAEKHLPEWNARFGHLPRNSSGYRLDLFSDNCYIPARILAGSEGSLGIITEITLKTEPLWRSSHSILLGFSSLRQACDFAPECVKADVLSCELIDQQILELGSKHPLTGGKKSFPFPLSYPAVLLIAFDADTTLIAEDKARTFIKNQCKDIPYCQPLDQEQAKMLVQIRKLGLTLLLAKRNYRRAVGFLEDMAVPVNKLGTFFTSFCSELQKRSIPFSLYGHAGPGCLHLRPYMDLRQKTNVQEVEELMLIASTLLRDVKGTLSGEHGDGLVRSWLAKDFFGPSLYEGFQEIKNLFDKENLCNPEKVVGAPSFTQYLKPAIKEPDTFLDFSEEWGFALSVDLCNGNGLCRKSSGAMCPSYQATRNEYDSTRARAKALREAISDKGTLSSLGEKQTAEILELCISCKACKKECPSSIDMAKMKAEVLYQRKLKQRSSLRAYLLAHFRLFAEWGSLAPPFANFLSSIASGFFGITAKRSLPKLAEKPFKGQEILAPDIYLFVDTYTKYVENSLGEDTIILLETLGLKVSCVQAPCCGRQSFSKGFLQEAKKSAKNLLEAMSPVIASRKPLLVLEPSCASMLIDDLPALFSQHSKEKALAKKLQHCTTSLESFLAAYLQPKHKMLFRKPDLPLLLHPHCHQRALEGVEPLVRVCKLLELPCEIVSKGCCGMAGSFGYEKEHDKISRKIAEISIDLPDKGQVIASGMSCRSQLQEHFQREAFHLSTALKRLLILP